MTMMIKINIDVNDNNDWWLLMKTDVIKSEV